SVSDIAGISQLSLSPANDQHLNPPAPIMEEPTAPAQGVTRNLSGFSADDDSKTIWHGYLYLLKSKGGMKQWKKMWIVLRSKNLVFYKDNEVRSTFPLAQSIFLIRYRSTSLFALFR